MSAIPERGVGAHGLRVLLVATPFSRPLLVAALESEDAVVMTCPLLDVLHEVDRGGIDVVLLALGANRGVRLLSDLAGRTGVPAVAVARESGAACAQLLTAGADDCLPWDVSASELSLRLLRAAHFAGRRREQVSVVAGRFTIDLERRVCSADGKPVHLAPKELGLLALLIRRDGRVVQREEALASVWHSTGTDDMTTVDVHVKRLRAKLEKDPARPAHLLTVRGLGYRFQA